ncbi:MAG: sugar phosphate nucleotidyltransferase, partial [Pseudomonadota bacterium]|nr:sugar phosphate nucleotidyltransferase [Pseudomonadota bacterium]
SIEPGQSAKIHKMIEKPPLDEAPSNLAVGGRYVLSEKIWDLLEFTPPGAGGEIQLTDAIDALMNLEQVDAYYMKGKSHDCGSKLGYMKANVEYALRHPALGEEFKEYLATVLK